MVALKFGKENKMNAKEFYRNYFGFEPFDFQVEVWDKIQSFVNHNPALLIKAPTGSGKTESVLAPFLCQFTDKKFSIAPRLIYVLPMRVLVNNLSERIRRYAQKIASNISVETQHGDLPNSPFFISDIVITTLDQFFYGFARSASQVGHHIDIPAGSIASSIVVFDEAHMYRDGFTFSIMRALIEILHKCRIPFVLMTATMPKSLEDSLFEFIQISDEQKIKCPNIINSSLNLQIFDLPLYNENDDDISNELLEKIKNKKTLIVVNQVKKAQKIYDRIKKRLDLNENEIVLLHSRFTRGDRSEHEARACNLLPRRHNGSITNPTGLGIVVSTQVLEAGIDFSAELLVTELAPADSLVQRAGRCARYENQNGEMLIFPLEEEKGHLPYEKNHIDNTLKWLREHPNFNIKDFNQVTNFVDETLDYQAKDYEAADTLIDLYECVLFADSRPENIQIRKNKSSKVIVVQEVSSEKKKEKKEDRLLNGIYELLKTSKFNDSTFEVDIKVLWGWYKKEILKYELQWDEKNDKKEPKIVEIRKSAGSSNDDDVPSIQPYKTYIIEAENYDKEMGVKNDESIFI